MSGRLRYNTLSSKPLGRIIYNAKLMNSVKNKKFLKKLIYSGKIVSVEENIIPTVFKPEYIGTSKGKLKYFYYKRLCEMMDVYQHKFGDDWDIHFDRSAAHGDKYIIFLFTIVKDVIVHKYELGTEHPIKDLIVLNTIGINNNGELWVPKMYGTRLSYTSNEIVSGYRHSHLRSCRDLLIEMDHFSNFCVGSSSDTAGLQGDLAIDFDKEKFEIYLYSQDSIMECESEIGNPHIKFQDLYSGVTHIMQNDGLSGRHGDGTVDLFKHQPLDLNFYFLNNSYYIKLDDRFKKFTKELIFKFFPESVWTTLICKKKEGTQDYYSHYSAVKMENNFTGNRYNNEDIVLAEDDTPPYVIYNGEKKYFNIIESRKAKSKIQIEEYNLHPNFLKYVHTRLEHNLQAKAIAASGINNYYSRNNAGQGTR